MAKVLRLLSILALLAFLTVASSAQHARPLYVIPLSLLGQDGGTPYTNGTVAFLSDHTFVAGICSRASCNLQTFDISGGSPRQIAQVNGIDHYNAISRSSDGGVLLTGIVRERQRGAILFDAGLHTPRWIPKIPNSSAIGEKIVEGQGKLLAHTTNLAAYWDHGTVQIQNVEGRIVGSFEVGGNHIPVVSFLGQDRVLFKDSEIRDFHGKVLRKLKMPGRSLGWKTRQTGDGSRVLYDSFTRRVGLAQTIKEDALLVPTMGMEADGWVPNGEVVRVTDTRSGKQCFEWYGRENLLPPFEDHADVDPTGRLVAIMTQGTLALYKLPDACTSK